MKYYECQNCDSENIFSEEYIDMGHELKCYKCKSTNLKRKQLKFPVIPQTYSLNMVSQNGSTVSKCTPEFREKLKSIKNYYKDSNIDY